MRIRVYFTDGTKEVYPSISAAEKGIIETVCGCDFAATVESVEELAGEGIATQELECTWSVALNPTNTRANLQEEEWEAEQQRRDEKRGLYPEYEDPCN